MFRATLHGSQVAVEVWLAVVALVVEEAESVDRVTVSLAVQ